MSSKKLSIKEQDAFDAFKGEFLKWQQKLQCGEYEVEFECKRLDGKWAEITISYSDKVATVVANRREITKPRMLKAAKHEVLHMLLFGFVHMAEDRWITRKQIDVEWERATRILEKVLK